MVEKAQTKTEVWLSSGSPIRMLDLLGRGQSRRKLKLFACACCRKIWHLLPSREFRRVVELTEQYVDGLVTEEELVAALRSAHSHRSIPRTPALRAAYTAARQRGGTLDGARDVASSAASAAAAAREGVILRARQHEKQCRLLRDIFGNPFHVLHLDPAWCRPGTVEIAQTIYEELRWQDLPILADALEEAGCTNADVLAHCRSGGEHVRGCWVVDLLLDKQ